MKTIRDIKHLKGARALLRVDFNVPIENGVAIDDTRVRAALPTIRYLRSHGAKVIMVSHLESIGGEVLSLKPIARLLSDIGEPVIFFENHKNLYERVERESRNGECLLLENLRLFEGEKENNPKFAEELASTGDVFVNEAFSVSHRRHASIVGVPKFLPSYAGIQFEKEVTNLSHAFRPPRPFLLILGGAKFETKLPLLKKFMNIADSIFVGGALSNDFFKEKGYKVGRSKVSDGKFDLSALVNNSKLILPVDVVDESGHTKLADSLSAYDRIVDAGAKTLEILKSRVNQAKFILWNGPLGLYENGYRDTTLELAKIIVSTASKGTETIVGGGDTLAAIAELEIEDKFTFVSTGGGAMLEFLAQGTLPGIQALEESSEN